MLQRSLIAAAVAACLFTACDRSGNADGKAEPAQPAAPASIADVMPPSASTSSISASAAWARLAVRCSR